LAGVQFQTSAKVCLLGSQTKLLKEEVRVLWCVLRNQADDVVATFEKKL
jgi:hypothetical protein